jgi:transposase-like protein
MELISKYKKYIIISLLVLIAFFVAYKFIKKESILETFSTSVKEDDFDYSDGNTKTDTLEKYGFHAVENYVVKEVGEVRRTPNFAPYNTIHKLRFGTKIYTKEVDSTSNIEIDPTLVAREIRNDYVAVYASKPVMFSDMPVGYMAKGDFVRKSEFKNFKPEPIKPEKIEFDAGVKATIEESFFTSNDDFRLPEDFRRYNKSVVYGDFNNDGQSDFSVLLDNADGTRSAVLIYFFNAEKNVYDLMLKKAYDGLLNIKSIKKTTSIVVNSESTSFPLDGVLITNASNSGYFHVFNPDNKSFMILPH